MTETEKIINRYERTYGPIPAPFGVSEDEVAQVADEFMKKGEPIPDDYDWWPDVPDDADA